MHSQALALSRKVGDHSFATIVLGNLAFVALLRGDHRGAREMYDEALVAAQELGIRWWVAWCLKGFARLAFVHGMPETAARLFGAAATLREATGTPLRPAFQTIHDQMVAEVRGVLSEAAFTMAWDADTVLPVEQAIAEARQVAAGRAADQAPSPLPSDAGHGLTRRETQVLRLVADGKTDREIAEALFVSRRTVSKHVESILAKLEVDTRAAAASAAVRRGLA